MRRYALCLLWFGLILASCDRGPRELVIFHTNDIHGHFLAERATWREDSASVGGFAALSGYLSQMRAEHRHSIYLDAGDLMTGNPICDIEFDGVEGGALLRFLELLDLDAFAIGNHELDKGADFARRFGRAGEFPVLCANLVEKGTTEPVFTPYVILKENSLRIGVIGLMMDDLSEVVAAAGMEPFEVLSIAKSAQRWIDEIDSKTDLIVLLTHNGLENDRQLAAAIRSADVIIGGHSHNRVEEPEVVNGIVIAQAGSYCRNLGFLKLVAAGDTISEYSGGLIQLVQNETKPLPAVTALADSLESVIDSVYGRIIGRTETPLTARYAESTNLGNLLCDLLRTRFDADIALANSGGIRKSLDPGPVTKLDVAEMLPFMNGVVLFQASGDELMKTARQQARAQGLDSGEILQMSGMTIRYRKDRDVVTVDEVRVSGELLSPEKSYTVVTHDYVSDSQSDLYLRFAPRDVHHTGQLFSTVIMQEIEGGPQPITADPRPRLEMIR